jgi:peroxiredoxin
MKLKIGDKAPAFVRDSSTGEKIALENYAGKWLVIYFYPKAFTPGCTRQTQRFQNNYPEIRELGAEVVGVSLDELPTQCDFSAKYEVSFPLLADTDKAMSKAYGVTRPLIPFNKRKTFVIDPQGTIRAVFHHELQVDKHLDDVVAFLKAHATGETK